MKKSYIIFPEIETCHMMTEANVNDAIVTRGLVREFGAVRAVDGVDLSVHRGEIYGFLGPNGAGKTTVIRMLITLLAPTAGAITVAGYDAVAQPDQVRLRIGAALQEAALDDKQTGRELLTLQGRLYGLRGREIAARMADLTDLIDIGDAMGRLIGTYSGGMKRRLDLAAALIHQPEILFLDEPTTGLDPISRNRIFEEIGKINTDLGVTIFLTTQYLEEADALAHRVGIIDRGRLAAQGTPEELKHSRGSDLIIVKLDGDVSSEVVTSLEALASVDAVDAHDSELTVSTGNGAALVSVVALKLNELGVGVRELTLRTPTLDDVFLQVTGSRLQREETGQLEGETSGNND